MHYYRNNKRVISLPSIAYNMFIEKVSEIFPYSTVNKKESTNTSGGQFEFFGVIYKEEYDTLTSTEGSSRKQKYFKLENE